VQQIEVRGLTIAFERTGRGPPLVLLHGGLSDHREWRRQLDDLADEFTVVAWDAPGCGGSSDPPETFRLPGYAACLAGFIDALGLELPHVLGLSWGSTLALELYRLRPEMPRSLILTAAYAGWAGSLPPEMADELVGIMSAFHPAGARAMLHSMAEADLRDVLPTIDVPTLLLYGEADLRSPRAVAEDMHARIPGSSLAFIPEAGHQSNIEAAAFFNTAVQDFVRSL
jgi:pimeloyl-ACP methyl ester carboxylesterase